MGLNFYKYLIIVSLFLVFLSIIQLIQGLKLNCPPKELIAPCTCIFSNIDCAKTSLSSSQLVDLFKKISREANDLHFLIFWIWHNSNLTELRANTFQNVTFDHIWITHCPNLIDVHEDAFIGSEDIATSLMFDNTG